jgi:hypothetical protein
MVGSPEAARERVGRCASCGTLVCGTCGIHAVDVYFPQSASREDASTAATLAALRLAIGQESRSVMRDMREREGVDLMVTLRCPRCTGELDFA